MRPPPAPEDPRWKQLLIRDAEMREAFRLHREELADALARRQAAHKALWESVTTETAAPGLGDCAIVVRRPGQPARYVRNSHSHRYRPIMLDALWEELWPTVKGVLDASAKPLHRDAIKAVLATLQEALRRSHRTTEPAVKVVNRRGRGQVVEAPDAALTGLLDSFEQTASDLRAVYQAESRLTALADARNALAASLLADHPGALPVRMRTTFGGETVHMRVSVRVPRTCTGCLNITTALRVANLALQQVISHETDEALQAPSVAPEPVFKQALHQAVEQLFRGERCGPHELEGDVGPLFLTVSLASAGESAAANQ